MVPFMQASLVYGEYVAGSKEAQLLAAIGFDSPDSRSINGPIKKSEPFSPKQAI
jgi:hypothetical protein